MIEDLESGAYQSGCGAIPERTWDTLVVGAGPAGAMAALHLARRGRSVLLLDRERFPRDKTCGDGISPAACQHLEEAGLAAAAREIGYGARSLVIFSPSRFRLELPGEYLLVRRRYLDSLIAHSAVDAGASFHRASVTAIEPLADGSLSCRIRDREASVRARTAILATGARLDLVRRLGIPVAAGSEGIAARCYVRSAVRSHGAIISYDTTILPGYGWIFPVAENLYNVGVGCFDPSRTGRRPNLRESFRRFTEEFPPAGELLGQGEVVSRLKGAILRCGLTGNQRLRSGNLLVVGESAGTTLPFTGEGIGKAMQTAGIAARCVSRALESGDMDSLSEYERTVERELHPLFEGYETTQRWLARRWLNDLVFWLSGRSRHLRRCWHRVAEERLNPREIFSLRGVARAFLG